jgi:hypothetical protein
VATFKVLYVDGGEREVVAQRMRADSDSTTFEVRRDGGWQKLAELPSSDVDTVRRRIIEGNGTFRWVTARPVRQAHGVSEKEWR